MAKGRINLAIGVLLVGLSIFNFTQGVSIAGIIPLLIGACLIYMGLRPTSRGAVILFGHACIVVGCMLVTWGVLLIPYSQADWLHVLMSPFFWGLISIFGGICANYHGFCRCVRCGAEAE
jgi:hypothetical protein